MSESLLTPFFAYVDQSLISSASNFFDNSTTSVLRELLQNSRRSGATRVDLYQQGNRWKYSDNGPGCAPQALLGLGASRWQAGVREKETPAGCGFFSLARRNPLVTCHKLGWRVQLNERHFNGQIPIEPEAVTAAEADCLGLVIEFDHDTSRFAYGVSTIARFMPIDFYLNGTKQVCHEDFMAAPSSSRAHKIIEFDEHITIRVDLVGGGTGSHLACYHGWTVDLVDRDYLQLGTTGSSVGTCAAVMVTRESALPLELPQRNNMISSDVTKKIKDLIYCTALELAVEALQDTCVASPQIWLTARSRGYTGPVLYPKFVGQLITRSEGAEMADYSVTSNDDDGDVYDVEGFITMDEFETGDYKFAPDNDLLTLISQTSIPFKLLDSGAGSVYDLDLDQYFAPGLRLVKPLESLKGFGYGINEGHEAYEWAKRLCALQKRGHAWYENVTVTAVGTAEDGKEFSFEGDPTSGRGGFDSDNLYDSMQLEFRSDDETEEVILPTEALFELAGDNYDSDVDFLITRKWLEGIPSGFVDTLASAVFSIRKCREQDGGEDDVTHNKISDRLQEKLAKFEGLDDFYKERFMTAAIAAVDDGLYHLDPKPGCIVMTFPVRHGQHHVAHAVATCEFLPPFSPWFTFEGSNGTVSCDETGNRDRFEFREPGTNLPVYSEFHSFDVQAMRQLGFKMGVMDILDACGWHDSTKKIYVTPHLPHVLWSLGFLAEPTVAHESPELRTALIAAVKENRVSPNLFSALQSDYPDMIKSIRTEISTDALPPTHELWVFSPRV